MPKLSEHVAQAAENTAFLSTAFTPTDNPRWRVVVCFYAALHYIDAYLDKLQSAHPSDHKQRRQVMQQLLRKGAIEKRVYEAYAELYDASMDARYRCIPIDAPRADRAQHELLPRIKDWVTKRVADNYRF